MAAKRAQSWTRQLLTFLIIFLLAGYLMYRNPACRGPSARSVRPRDARIVDVKIADQVIHAEVADTPELRLKGLQGRTELQPGYGMLFVFEELSRASFRMKETTIPLSLAFIKADGTIVQIEKMQPGDLRQVTSLEPVKYALEVRQGYFEDHGFQPGIKADLPSEIPPPAPEIKPEGSEAKGD